MARKTATLGELAIAIALKTQALEQGLKEVEKKLKDHNKNVQKTGQDYDKLAIVAGLAFWKISSAIKAGADAYNQFNNAMIGLRSIVQGTGNDFAQAQQFIEEFTKDGLVPAGNAAQALKNLLARGFGFEQAVDIMNRFKDAAAFGRQGALSMGEAIQGAAEGLKNSNSTMIDNVGVTENLSKMWERYAESIGKTVGTLTEAEKAQAEYLGIMEATKHQIGDAARYANEFAGSQARASAEALKLKQSFGSALVPALDELLKTLTPIISALSKFVSDNPQLVAAVTLAATSFLGVVTAITAVGAAVNMLKPALAALGTSFSALLTNPVVLALTALAGAVALTAYNINQARKEQEQYNQAVERFAKIKAGGISRQEIPQLKEEAQQLKEVIDEYEILTSKTETLQKANEGLTPSYMALEQAQYETGISAEKLNEAFRKLGLDIDVYKGNIDEAKRQLEMMNEAIFEAERVTADEYNTQLKNLALKRKSVEETKQLIQVYKTAQKGSTEWLNAQKELAEIFPQFSTAAGIQIDAIEKVTKAQEEATKAEWTMLQAKIKMTMMDIQRIKSQKEASISQYEEEQKVMKNINDNMKSVFGLGTPFEQFIGKEDDGINNLRDSINELNKEYNALEEFLKIDWHDVAGVTPISFEKTISSSANSAYQQALRLFEHRKHLNQLTLEDQIKVLEEIKSKHAKTSDEIMDIEERIYDSRQALREENLRKEEEALKQYKELFKKQEEALDDRTSVSFRWIDRQKLYEKLDVDQEIAAYERIIKYHKEYLDKVMADEKISQEEKQRIWLEETMFIQDQQDKIYQIRKKYLDDEVEAYYEAQQEKIEAEYEAEEERLRKQLDEIDREYREAEEEKKAKELSEKLKKLKEEEQKYLYAQTREGREKLLSIQEEIADTQEEIEEMRIEKEKQMRKDEIQQQIEDLKSRYKSQKEELEKQREEMLSQTSKFAQDIAKEQENASKSMADTVSTMFQNWQRQNESFFETSLRKLQEFVTKYRNLMSQISFGGTSAVAGIAGNSNVVVNVSDNGDKYIYNKDEAIDYTKELFDMAKNTMRGG